MQVRWLVPGLILLLGGCSNETLYYSAQGWRKQQCEKLVDMAERNRCVKEMTKPYEQYQKEAEPASAPARSL